MPEKLEAILDKVERSDLSSIRNIVSEIMQVINSPASSAAHLKRIVEIDPPLCARILRIANSALYGFERQISSIQEAIIAIGFETVKELALSQKVCEIFESTGKTYGYSRGALWKHSIAVGLTGKLIARREFRERGEVFYAAGLLHDVGLIVEDEFLAGPFRRILRDTESRGCNIFDVERETIGLTHAEIGGALARRWRLPEELADAIENHHDPERAAVECLRISRVLHVCDFAVQSRQIGYRDSPKTNLELINQSLASLDVRPKAIDMIMDEVARQISVIEKIGGF